MPKKFILVRHGVPDGRGDQAPLDQNLKWHLDGKAEEIAEKLQPEEIGRVVLLSSELTRAYETAEYIGEKLAERYIVSDVITTPLLNLNGTLGRIPSRQYDPAHGVAYSKLKELMDQHADNSSAVVAASHQPVIYHISRLNGVEAVEGYGAVTEIY